MHGQAGVDGKSAYYIERQGVGEFLAELREDLKAQQFRPLPVRERMIPKAGGKKLRRLGIPTVRDRIVQAALKLVLAPIFEAGFEPCSYGFRPNRRAHDAIAEIHHFGTNGHRWVLDADIEACFDRIDHVALMDRVRTRVKDRGRRHRRAPAGRPGRRGVGTPLRPPGPPGQEPHPAQNQDRHHR
ncbi:reverse transcriptase domain-containing protein [Streptomyces sp. NPDC057474]|uniref:reverse transcriptase domain-containing protein n=1 Tax=Streptomyces sp. NPDC057474 TaxID=3346144 RepID=UPI0036C470E1